MRRIRSSFVSLRSPTLALALLSVPLLLLGCGRGEPAADADQPEPGQIIITGAGWATPESVLHDETADIYLVSNINGDPTDKDDNGFISRLSPDGLMQTLKWIDGASDNVTLNAPKGMAIVGDVLYVTDITVVRKFNRNTGAPLGEIPVANASFLNDLTPASDGGVYLTDMGVRAGADGLEPAGGDAIYHIAPNDDVHTLLADPNLGNPNGILEADGHIWVVTSTSGELFEVVDGVKANAVSLPQGGLDGIISMGDDLMISSWAGQAVFRGPGAGPFEAVINEVQSPADIGFDGKRHRVLIPLFQTDEVRIVPVH